MLSGGCNSKIGFHQLWLVTVKGPEPQGSMLSAVPCLGRADPMALPGEEIPPCPGETEVAVPFPTFPQTPGNLQPH